MVTIHQIEDAIPEDASPIYDDEQQRLVSRWRSKARRTWSWACAATTRPSMDDTLRRWMTPVRQRILDGQ